MDLSVIIVNHNTKPLLRDCLTSLIATMPSIDYEIIVINNTPEDGSTEMIQKEFSKVRAQNNNEKHGFAWNNNAAYQLSSGKLIWMLNPDTVIKPGACQIMLEFLKNHPKAGLVGSRILLKNGMVDSHSCIRFPGLMVDLIETFSFSKLLLSMPSIKGSLYPEVLRDAPFQVDVQIGASILFRREVVNDLGFLDERFFMYFEETDWCCRAKKKGWEIWHIPAAEIFHFIGGSSEGNASTLMLHYVQSQQLYYQKHLGAFRAILVRLIMIAGLTLRLVKWSLVKIISPGKRPRANDEIKKWQPPLKWLLTGKGQ